MNRKKGKNYSLVKHLDFLLRDLVGIEIAFFVACQIRQETFNSLTERYLYMGGILFVAFWFIVLFWNIYSGILRRNFWDEFKSVFALVAGIFVALTMYCFLSKRSEEYSRAVLITFFLIAIPLLFLVRIIHKEWVRKKLKQNDGENLLFIHENDLARKISKFTSEADSGIIVTGIVTYDKASINEYSGIPVVCSRDELEDYIDNHNVNSVFIYLQGVPTHEYTDYMVRQKVLVYRALRNLEKSSFRYSVEEMNGYKTICVKEREIPIGQAALKRIGDIVGSLVGIF